MSATELSTASALLERAYRLALVLSEGSTLEPDLGHFVAAELLDVIDEARGALVVVMAKPPGPSAPKEVPLR